MNDADFPVADVLRGIDAAERAGLGPLKINMVVKRGTNDAEILPMARHFRGRDVALRFIEYMDVGATNGWRMDEVLPSAEVVRRDRRRRSRWRPAGVGASARPPSAGATPSPASPARSAPSRASRKAFCRDCNRARLSTEGKLFLCLFASRGHDLRALCAAARATPRSRRRSAWSGSSASDRYSELRGRAQAAAPGSGERRVEMHYIGG